MNYNTTNVPLSCSMKLSSTEGTVLADPTYYRKLNGKLNFFTHTRVDITYMFSTSVSSYKYQENHTSKLYFMY